MIKYRPDIDGLRSLAILPVLFFHSGIELFSGGYVGVDIFFTISGFLITSIIIKDIENNRFSYISFFKKRIRRLMPMAILIYFFVLSVFFFFYPSIYYKDITTAVFSSLLFFSNIYFWKEGGGYFGSAVENNPLLHTWSLSVEEQFYLVFPILLILLYKITNSFTYRFLLILLGILISLSVAIIYSPSIDSHAAFYLLPPRMYELALGSLTALFVLKYPMHNIRNIKYLQDIGVFFILLSVFTFNKETIFPSYSALLPCLGAVVVMLSNGSRGGLSNLVLNSRIAVYIGLISYSLYLWHWPLMVMKNWFSMEKPGFLLNILVIFFSFILSVLSYKYVENPFRNKLKIPDNKLLIFSGISFVLIFTLSVMLYFVGNDFYIDPDGETAATYSLAVSPSPNRALCFEKVRRTGVFSSCVLSAEIKNKEKSIFVWGDSHGSAFIPILKNISEKHKVVFSNNSGCPPVINIKRTDLSQSCKRINKQIFNHILTEKYDLVLLVGAFSNYLNWGIVGHLDAEHDKNPAQSLKDFSMALSNTLEILKKKQISFLIFAQPPRFSKHIPDEFLKIETLGLNYQEEKLLVSEYKQQIEPLIRSVPKSWKESLVTLTDIYCPDGECISMLNGKLLYKDSHHISNAYTDFLSIHVTKIIEKKLNE